MSLDLRRALRDAQRDRGLTMADVAELSGLHVRTVRRVLRRGDHCRSLAACLVLVRVLRPTLTSDQWALVRALEEYTV